MEVLEEHGNNIVTSDDVMAEGGSESITFQVTEEMVTYVCEYHENTMRGDIETQ
jgi:plastocyanin